MLLNIIVAWVYLQVVFLGVPIHLKFWLTKEQREQSVAGQIFHPALEAKIKGMLKQKYNDLGPATFHEMAVGACFIVAVTSWILHDPRFIPGKTQGRR